MGAQTRSWEPTLVGCVGPWEDTAEDRRGIERRRSPRYRIGGQATARFAGLGGQRIAGIRLSDSSACGLSIECAVPVEEGAVISIYFGDCPVPGRVGVVRRCEMAEDGQGWSLGVECGAVAAA
jgi:hypothetical protein